MWSMQRLAVVVLISAVALTVVASVEARPSVSPAVVRPGPWPRPVPPWYYSPMAYDYPAPVDEPLSPYVQSLLAGNTNSNPYSAPNSTPTLPDNRAVIEAQLPVANARLWLDGQEITGSGVSRRFLSTELYPGQMYRSRLAASWVEGGRLQQRTIPVELRAGATVQVDFTRGGK